MYRLDKIITLFFCICIVVFQNNCLAQEKNEEDGPIRISIYFGGGSYYIDEEQQLYLQNFIEEFDKIEDYNISIHSHTDNIGGIAYNQWLSEMRSKATVELLIILNVPEDLISIKDFGLYNPVYSNDTWIGKIKNRRVDILFWPVVM
jgi:outer membrane protein OmpA-like peptidoglycan-associated protein